MAWSSQHVLKQVPVLAKDLSDGTGFNATAQQLVHRLCASRELNNISLSLQPASDLTSALLGGKGIQ